MYTIQYITLVYGNVQYCVQTVQLCILGSKQMSISLSAVGWQEVVMEIKSPQRIYYTVQCSNCNIL